MSGVVDLHFLLSATADDGSSAPTYRVELKIDGEGGDNGAPLTEPVQVNLARMVAMPANEEEREELANDLIWPKVEEMKQDEAPLTYFSDVGAELWGALCDGRIKTRLEKEFERDDVVKHIRLSIPPELSELPWECIYDDDISSYFAIRDGFCVIRDAGFGAERYANLPRDVAQPSLLALAPSFSGLMVETELIGIKQVFSESGQVEPEVLKGLVDSDAYGPRIRSRKHEIVHYIGHGQLADSGRVEILFNSKEDPENWIPGEIFSESFRNSGVLLAVLNCCESNSFRSYRLSGLGEVLAERGVPVGVVMQYAIEDTIAAEFSKRFYGALMETGGRIDIAIQRARSSLLHEHSANKPRAPFTPVLFMVRDFHQLFMLPRPPGGGGVVEPRPVEVRGIDLPSRLTEAAEACNLVPIVGSGLLKPPTERRSDELEAAYNCASVVSLLHSIDDALKTDDGSPIYADREEIALAERSDFFAQMALSRMAQLFVAREGVEESDLLELLNMQLKSAAPTASHVAIARWGVPAVYYLPFDGLMEAAYEDQSVGRSPNRVYGVKDAFTEQANTHHLVLVRGSITRPDTIAITEQDCTRLLDEIGNMPTDIDELLARKLKCSLLFLGVHPRDPLVRRLGACLLGIGRSMGPAYFVAPDYDKADEAYWSSLEAKTSINFVDANPKDVVLELSKWFQ